MYHLVLLLLLSFPLSAQLHPAGTWYGTLDLGSRQLHLEVNLTEGKEGWEGNLKSDAESPAPIPFETVTVTEDSLHFGVPAVGIRYRGAIATDSISGTFSRGSFRAPLSLYRVSHTTSEVVDGTARPQDPADRPYQRQEVTFPGGATDVVLAGEITRPADGPPRAGIVLVSGSGPQDRNEDLGPVINHRPFLVLSDFLTRRGYAVLRYDDRGVAESTGNFATATSADFADDAAAAYRYLRDQLPEGTPTGLGGHSEGGLILPLVARAEQAVDFLVLLAAPGLPIDELMAEQRRLVGKGEDPLEPVQMATTAYLKQHPDQDDAAFRAGLNDTIIATIPELPEAMRAAITDPNAFAKTFVNAYAGPWMRYFFAYDPEPALAALRMPVLAINGEKDVQVSPANLTAIADILATAGNEAVATRLIPGANHLLQPAETGLPQEYGQIELTIDPAVLELIADWLDARFP